MYGQDLFKIRESIYSILSLRHVAVGGSNLKVSIDIHQWDNYAQVSVQMLPPCDGFNSNIYLGTCTWQPTTWPGLCGHGVTNFQSISGVNDYKVPLFTYFDNKILRLLHAIYNFFL